MRGGWGQVFAFDLRGDRGQAMLKSAIRKIVNSVPYSQGFAWLGLEGVLGALKFARMGSGLEI